jgi:hypothetical protein
MARKLKSPPLDSFKNMFKGLRVISLGK